MRRLIGLIAAPLNLNADRNSANYLINCLFIMQCRSGSQQRWNPAGTESDLRTIHQRGEQMGGSVF